MFQRVLPWLMLVTVLGSGWGGVLVPKDSTWQLYRGYSEASAPDQTAWRALDFDDTFWEPAPGPLFYENDPGSPNAYTGNTVLYDMPGYYTCVFLRQTFVVNDLAAIGLLQVAALSDDGFIAWINGQEVARFNMPAGEPYYTNTSLPALAEPVAWWTNVVTDPRSCLVPGTNVLAIQAFNAVTTSSDFIINPALYYTPDLSAPKVTLLYPAAGAVVRQLVAVEVGFDEPVSGVDAADLRINGQPATNLTAVTPSQFVFTFPQPAQGQVQLSWALGHNIRDQSIASNLFSGAAWSYTLNSNAPLQDVILSEFMASNSGDRTNSVKDELGNSPDWIELYNGTSSAVDLTGWILTDDVTRPTRWRFPATVMPARSYLLVFASDRNTNVNGQLHTNFKLSAGGSYLALADPAGNVVSSFAPAFPPQAEDISYGRDRLDPLLAGYFTNATPGAANATRGAGFGSEINFSRASGTFTTDFWLALSTADPNCDIRYVLVQTNVSSGSTAITNVPTAASPLYTSPVLVSNTMQVRARAFPRTANLFPGPPVTRSYVKISPAAATFTSDLPVILLHNLAGGSIPSSRDQNVIAMVFEPVEGRTSLTNPPTLVTRAGINIRGSSTAGLPQSSFALEFWDEYNTDEHLELLGLPAQSDWVLYGQNGYDTSFLHNPLMHQLGRNLGRYSSRTRFAEVFLSTAGGTITYSAPAGGNYFGLYTVEEKVKRDGKRVDLEELEPQHTTAPLVTGGYLLKIDRSDSNERSFYDAALQRSIIFQEPPGLEMVTTARQAQYNYITAYFAAFGNALWGANYTDPELGYAAYIDVNSWIEDHILNALAYNVDAYRLSGYFFKDREKKIEMGPLWDFDRSLGTYNPNTDSWDNRCFNPRLWRVQLGGDQGTDFFGDPNLLGVRWWQRLFTDPDFWQRWIDRWTELRRNELTTNQVFAVIDTLSAQLAQAQSRQAAKWSYTRPRSGSLSANGYSHSFPGSYQGELTFLKRWLGDRLHFIDTNFLRAPVFSGNGGAITSGYTVTITAPTIEANTTVYYTLDGRDPRLPGGWISPEALSGYAPLPVTLYQNARLFARSYNPDHRNVTGGSVGGNPPLSSPWSGPTVATFVVQSPRLVVTEIMFHPAAPAAGPYAAGDFEFIELKNTGTADLNLVGIHFTNGIQFTFTSDGPITVVEPGGYVVLVKNQAAFLSRYPAVNNIAGEFLGNLDNAGERLCLEGPLLEPMLDFEYNDAWQPVADGLGFSLVIRNENGATGTWTNAASWRPSSAIGGSPGRADPAPPNLAAVVVNEALTHTDPPQVDAVELFNPTGLPASIGGWFLSDDPEEPAKYRIPTNTVVPAGGFVQFSQTQFGSGSNGFALNSLGDEIYLFSGDGTNLTGYRHGFEFGPQANGIAFGRYVTSDGREHFVAQQRATLGTLNAGPAVGPFILNEIMCEPRPFGLNANTLEEFVEIRNITAQPAPLFDPLHPTNAWRIDGGIQFAFPAGVTVDPLSCILVVNFDPVHDPVMLAWFRTRYALETNTLIFGPYAGNLANEGERVALYRPDHPEVPPSPIAGYVPYILAEEVNYYRGASWPSGAAGTGHSLSRVSAVSFSDEPANWRAATPTPGGLDPAAPGVDTDADLLPDEWELAHGLDPRDGSGLNGPGGDPDHDNASNRHEYLAGTDPNSALDRLQLEISILAPACVLQFTPAAGRTYALEKCQALGGAWAPLVTDITGTNTFTWHDALSGNAAFYRVRATGPASPPANLRLSNPQVIPSSAKLQFPARAGRVYSLERRENLSAAGSWTTLRDNLTGTNTLAVFDPAAQDATRYYRLRVRLGP